ncbi:hypothetical protein [Psychrobacter sp. TWP2-1-2]|uniref:hypothetical protein n=1 Tax=Psychrobacter sp. TWP2-1-2 TaxID=2804623 RepID=UPI003CEB6998
MNTNNDFIVIYSNHSPINSVANIRYLKAEQPLSQDYLKAIAGDKDFISLPLTYNNGTFYPCRIHSSHQTVGYALITKENAKKIINKKRFTDTATKEVKRMLFKILINSY